MHQQIYQNKLYLNPKLSFTVKLENLFYLSPNVRKRTKSKILVPSHRLLSIGIKPSHALLVIFYNLFIDQFDCLFEQKPIPNGREDWISTAEEHTTNATMFEVILGEDTDELRPYMYYYVRAYVTYRSGEPYEYTSNDALIQTFETEGNNAGTFFRKELLCWSVCSWCPILEPLFSYDLKSKLGFFSWYDQSFSALLFIFCVPVTACCK